MLYTHEGYLHTVKKSPTELPNKLKEMLKQKPKDILQETDEDSDSTMMSLSSSNSSSSETEINMVDEMDMFQELDEKTQVMFRVSDLLINSYAVVQEGLISKLFSSAACNQDMNIIQISVRPYKSQNFQLSDIRNHSSALVSKVGYWHYFDHFCALYTFLC